MSTTEVLVLVAALVLLALVAVVALRAKRRRGLQHRFGPEYDRTLEQSGGRREAERELAERAQRREQLDIRPLEPGESEGFSERWRTAQEDFVDRPALAVRQADMLVAEVMHRRGYPVGDFDQQARDVSVDHADVVEEYRAAHDISRRNDAGQASTEDLRQAMVHYRALFAELLHDGRPADGPGYATDEDAPRREDLRHRL